MEKRLTLLLSLSSALALAGCPAVVPATQVLVEIDADPGVRAEARSLSIRVEGGPAGALELRHTESIGAPIDWPVLVAVTPAGGDASRSFAVSAEALGAASVALGAVRVESSFVPRRALLVRLVLEDCCRDETCDADQTCRACACAAARLDPSTLPDYVARDAGAPLGDGGPGDGGRLDARPDAGGCGSDADCPGGALPVCDAGTCVECTPANDAACGAGEACDAASRSCVATCGTDADCDAGRICTAGACVEGCRVDRPCLGSATCCADACVDLDDDPRHCGACGAACGAGEACCDRTCTDTTSDLESCGACGNACGTAGGAPSCAAGTCAITCDATHDDCDGLNANGCETDLRTLTDCGACGDGCSVNHGTPTCATGTCAVAACDPGYLDCTGGAADGCEAQVSIDPANCGACGASCTAPNATTACVGSACAVVSCAGGFGDCDGSAASGCETTTTGNFDHCGACGRSCALRGTVRACSGTDCASLGCMAGFSDCNGGADGCEAFLASDRNNCGGCGIACGGGAHCENGGCCPLGLGFCPGVGCVNTASDRNNCGVCGRVCPGTCFDYDCI